MSSLSTPLRVFHLALIIASSGSILANGQEVGADINTQGQCLNLQSSPLNRGNRLRCPPPLLDSPAQLKDAPWTHPVQCIDGKTAEDAPTVHCLYTSSSFGDGHGTSIITKPATAADLIGADAMEELPRHGALGNRSYTPGPVSTADGPAYEIQDVPGKGKGLVAKRKIKQEEIVMLDFPALIVSTSFLMDTKAHFRRRLLKKAIARLPEATQKLVYDLSRSTGGEMIDDILGTNTCSFNTGDNEPHLGLYPEFSASCLRVNHACAPNAFYRFSQRTLTLELVTYRDIQPGEEITISYAHLTTSHDGRRKQLLDNWGFRCTCSLCRGNTHEITAHEDNRNSIRRLQRRLLDASETGQTLAAVELAHELLGVTEREGLRPLMAEFYDILKNIYFDDGDLGNAQRYGELAVQSWRRLNSVDESHLNYALNFLHYVEERRQLDRKTMKGS